jgi:hypothetical protein
MKLHRQLFRSLTLPLGLLLAAFSPAAAQDGDVPPPAGGFHIRSLTGYAVYYSNSLPGNGGFQPTPTNLGADVGGGVSADLGWTHYAERTNATFTYVPSYTGRLRYSGWNALNHAMSFNVIRKLAPRWTFGLSGAVNLSTLDQFLFAPTTLGAAAASPAKFDDLATAMLAGKFNDPRLASILGGAQVSQSPLQTLLYGDRVLNSAAQASLSYSYSPRLSITVNGGGSRSQHLSQNDGTPNLNGYLNSSTSESEYGTVGLSYSLSPRTRIGGSVTGSRAASEFEDTFTTRSVGSLGRTLGNRWFVQVQAGIGVMHPLRQTTLQPLSTSPHPVAGGSIGYKSFSHTLLGSYDRTVSDSYGLGASTNSSATASWLWKRPGRDWWLTADTGWQRLEGSFAGDVAGWHSSAGIGRSLGHAVLLIDYAYLRYSGTQQRTVYNVSQSAVRVSMSWRPNPALFR